MIGYVTARLLSREPLYHGLSRVFIAAAIQRGGQSRKVGGDLIQTKTPLIIWKNRSPAT